MKTENLFVFICLQPIRMERLNQNTCKSAFEMHICKSGKRCVGTLMLKIEIKGHIKLEFS